MSFYVKSGSGVTEFAQSTAYSLGQRIVPKRADAGTNYLLARCAVWECTTAGTSAAAEPTWPAAIIYDTTTVTSGGATFKARKPGFSSGTTADWTFATIYVDYINNNKHVTGETIYISNNHAENNTVSAVSASLAARASFLCVEDTVAPPTTLATGAVVQTTGEFAITVPTSVDSYWYGVIFICASTATGTRHLAPSGRFENCSFRLGSTGASSSIVLIGRFINCSFKFAAAGQMIAPGGFCHIIGGSLLSGGTSPTALFASANMRGVIVEGFDLTNANAAINLIDAGTNSAATTLSYIKLPASWSGQLMGGSAPYNSSQAEMAASDNAGTNYIYRKKAPGGEAFTETTLVRTGGASNGVTTISHKLVTTSSASFPGCTISGPDIVKWNDTVGSPIGINVELLHDSATPLTDKEAWIEVTYFGSGSSPLASFATSAPSIMATASDLASSTETWTTTGMSNPNRQKISLSITPQMKGFVVVRFFLAKASKTVYFCPKLSASGGGFF